MGILSSAIQVTDGPRYGPGRFRYVGDLRRPVLILHTIEGSLSYRTAQRHQNPPHLWYSPARRELYQTVDLRGPAFALRHPRGTPETNNRGPCLQVELEGFARQTRTWPEAYYENIAQDVVRPLDRFCRENYGVTLVGGPSTRSLRYADETDSIGPLARANSPLRLTDRQWLDAHGLVGHQHVPDNTHWDPGYFRMESLLSFLTDVDRPRVLQLFSGDQRLLRGSDVRDWQELLVAFGLLVLAEVDGLFGRRTDAATRTLQGQLGLPVDGIVTVQVASVAADALARREAAPPGEVAPAPETTDPSTPAEPTLDLTDDPATGAPPSVPLPRDGDPVEGIDRNGGASTAPEPTSTPSPTITREPPSREPWVDLTGDDVPQPTSSSGSALDATLPPVMVPRPAPTATSSAQEATTPAGAGPTPTPPPTPTRSSDDESEAPSSMLGRIFNRIARFFRSLFN